MNNLQTMGQRTLTEFRFKYKFDDIVNLPGICIWDMNIVERHWTISGHRFCLNRPPMDIALA